MKKRKKKGFIEKYKYFVAGFLIGTLIFFTYATNQFGMKNKVQDFIKENNKQKEFLLEDKCGPMPGSSTLSHTIANEELCENTCRARCVSDEFSYKNAVFSSNPLRCNECQCFCK